MIRRVLASVAAVGIVGVVAGAIALATGPTPLPQPVLDTLTTIDSVPTKKQLDHLFGMGEAAQSLSTIARDTSGDYGIRLRAIHALAKYCGSVTMPCSTSDLTHQTLTQLIDETRTELVGANLLLLRAAIETIGTLQVASDVNILVPLLDHPSRDIRAAAARALRDLCNTQAITPLRVRYTSESTEQVKLAISEALRILGQCSMQ